MGITPPPSILTHRFYALSPSTPHYEPSPSNHPITITWGWWVTRYHRDREQ
jgi:hypothetical protein